MKKKISLSLGGVGIFAVLMFFVSQESSQMISISDDDSIVESVDVPTENLPIPKDNFKVFGDFWIEIEKDKLNVKAPIVDGVGSASLKRGVGRHVSTPLPNAESGNVVISGHRWLPGDNPSYTVFRHLDQLEIGDEIFVYHADKKYHYRVRERKTVSDDAVEILAQTQKPQLTLYTCTPLFTALKRLVFVADLVGVDNESL